MKTASKGFWLKFLSGLLIFGFSILPLNAQKKKTGGASKTAPKKAATENSDRDLKPRSENSGSEKSAAVSPSKKSPVLNKNKRIALIIGNSQYDSSPLRNPVNDALLIGKSLENLGFQVSVKENLSFQEMKQAIQSFSEQLAGGAVGLFYFAGHGIQINGRNFLIPVDFNAEQTDVSKQAVEVDYVIKEITGKGGLNILILDACRNAPTGYTVPTDKEGLAEIRNAPIGTYIAFSTAPGKKAKDGKGNNSPYALSLADNLRLRPSRLEDVFIRTRIQMDNITTGQQTPWENSSLNSIFFFSEDITAPAQNLGAFNPDISAIGRILNLPIIVPLLNESGNLIKQARQTASYFVEAQTGLEMMQVQSGNFKMGTSWEIIDAAYKDAKKYKDISQETIAAEMPQHQVNVPGFFISKTEITQAQWQAVMGSLPEIEPDFRGGNLPVVKVSWRQANAFCKKLSQMTGNIYRLPTEAEWEYAAKAGSESPFAFGKTITSDLANYKGTFPFLSVTGGVFRNELIPVGSLKNLNAFGLADMHGNVWEWTADNWHEDYNGAPTDGSVWEAQEPEEEDSEEQDPRLLRVIRGGSWDSIASNCRSTSRRKQPQMSGSNKIGFRVVMQ